MSIKISTDSSCDLPQDLLEQYDIAVLPLTITMGGKSYIDALEITQKDIEAHVDSGGDLPATAAVNVAAFTENFTRFLQDHEAVIHIDISSGSSSCYQNACIAASDLKNVYVVDSKALSGGLAMVVLAACRAAREGMEPQAIVSMLEDMVPRVETNFLIDRLDYMRKGGRCSMVAAMGANLLKLHPAIELRDGAMAVTKKYRGSMEKAIVDYVHDRLAGRTDLDLNYVFIGHTCDSEALVSVVIDEIKKYASFQHIVPVYASCTIFSHSGQNTVSVMVVRKK